MDALYQEALANRLDLASSEYNLEARQQGRDHCHAAAWPRVDLFASYDRSRTTRPTSSVPRNPGNTYFG